MDAFLETYQDFGKLKESDQNTEGQFAEILIKRGSLIQITEKIINGCDGQARKEELIEIVKEAQQNHVQRFKNESKALSHLMETQGQVSN